jgi:hypothetical protein
MRQIGNIDLVGLREKSQHAPLRVSQVIRKKNFTEVYGQRLTRPMQQNGQLSTRRGRVPSFTLYRMTGSYFFSLSWPLHALSSPADFIIATLVLRELRAPVALRIVPSLDYRPCAN